MKPPINPAFPIVVISLAGLLSLLPSQVTLVPVNLRCEYRVNALGIDETQPRLTWHVQSGERGQRQTAYEILVASSEKLLRHDSSDLWDSGKVASGQTINVVYAGKPLVSREVCFWKVKVWDKNGKASGWSEPALWSMGLLNSNDWQAKWIGVYQTETPAVNALAPGKLQIVSATYESLSGTPARDVTELLAGRITGNTVSITADNDTLGGDPAPDQKKRLVVKYALNGAHYRKTIMENERLAINVDPYAESEKAWARPRYLRKPFTLNKTVRRATLYATALGLYELRLNGRRVGDRLLTPEWTDYSKHVQYQTYDVTAMIQKGSNVLAAILGNGWYCGGWQHWTANLQANYGTEPSLLTQLEIEFTDGSRQTIISDGSWRGTMDGPLQFAGIYEGVTYNALKEMPGWDLPGFDDAKWLPVTVRQVGDSFKVGQLISQRDNPIRVTQEIKPVAVTEPRPGVYVFAFDQNMVGWCRLQARGDAGETVELQYGEMRNPDGTVFTGNLTVVSHNRQQLDRYTFKGGGIETFEPLFTYHGFRYVEVRGLSEKPGLDTLTGVVFHSDCPEVGSFTCSDPLLTRLALNILWSQRGNYMGIPTDCPQRNERCGYTGDAEFFMRAAVYNMDVAAFFNNWLVAVFDAQQPGGWFADHAPYYCKVGAGPNIGWSDAGIICPYEIYRTYGDTRVVREHYVAMKRYLDWLADESKDFLFTGRVGNGDWLNTGGGASKEVIGTAFSAYDFKLMAEMAEAIGETNDAAEFRNRADKIAAAFAKAYIDSDGHIKNCSQSGYALAFTMGLVPENIRDKMAKCYAEEVSRFDWHPRTGFIGTPRLLAGLHLAGLDDDAYKMLLTKTAPSWLYPVSVGATTIWERWDAWNGKTPQGGMNSLNHYALGSVGEYLFGMIGGIQPAAPGYRKIRIQPVIREDLSWADTSYDSIYGKIETYWKVDDGKLKLNVTIPPNTTATVYVPAQNIASVTESGKPAGKMESVKFLGMENETAVFNVGSGKYQFVSKNVSNLKN